MNQGDFIAGYCMRARITLAIFLRYKVALPCTCGDEICDGWAAVTNHPESIADHWTLYAPRSDQRRSERTNGE